jgi:UDP-N-acetylmuramate dehydrogenase
VYDALRRIVPADRIFTDEPMAGHTSFKIGGPADVYVQPATRGELLKLIKKCRGSNVPFVVLGLATNVLVPDEGLSKVVVQLHPHFCGCSLSGDGTVLTADAGAPLAAVADMAWKEGLSGLEFASGIPGTVGGAICMNAGAYNHDIAGVCLSVDMLMPDGRVGTVPADDMEFGYRSSIVQENGAIVLSASFVLRRGSRDAIKAYMNDLNSRRRDSQPLDFPSVGSTFKRPPGHYAGKLIMDSGLKGFSVGGAMVSEKHAGFIINTGGASARDVLDLIEHIQAAVWDGYGVLLEPEVKILCSS